VILDVYNILGQHVSTLGYGSRQASMKFNGMVVMGPVPE